MNTLGRSRTPFFFLISYDTQRSMIFKSQDNLVAHLPIYYTFPDQSNHVTPEQKIMPVKLTITRTDWEIYQKQFQIVQDELRNGNIYLINLTRGTPIESSSGLMEIYMHSRAKYKVCVPDQFVVFSPETFVRFLNGKAYTYPMKGTIRADLPHAREHLENDAKEKAEHASIVDLLRNDLGQICNQVRVKKFRYFEKVQAGKYELWQVSSEIEGNLPANFHDSLGTMIFQLLPAGSISGVPKQSAVKIINKIEDYPRGFYTGICGYFDGNNLDSAVMIRFIEQTDAGLVYKSGGGIHSMSDLKSEFEELIDKIYVPVD